MRSAKHITAFVLGFLALAGCADTGATTGVLVTASASCANLSGNFEATGFTVTSTANSTVRQDLLGGGGTFGLDFADGNFTSTFLGASDTTATTNTGAFTATSGSITLGNQTLFTGGATGNQLFTCSVFGNTLTLTSPSMDFLFPGTTTAQPANVTITLHRTT